MKNNNFYQLFLDELADIYNAEHQIVNSFPHLIKIASLPELKEALTHDLNEAKDQIIRIEKICQLLDIPLRKRKNEGIGGILEEAEKLIESRTKSPTLDAALICAVQKIKHYEIASYGALRSFAKHLDLNREIIHLIQDTLNEEGNGDKTLTKIAEGSIFSTGVNQKAVEEILQVRRERR